MKSLKKTLAKNITQLNKIAQFPVAVCFCFYKVVNCDDLNLTSSLEKNNSWNISQLYFMPTKEGISSMSMARFLNKSLEEKSASGDNKGDEQKLSSIKVSQKKSLKSVLEQFSQQERRNNTIHSRILNTATARLAKQNEVCEIGTLELCEAQFLKDSSAVVKAVTETEILQACIALDDGVECLLNFMVNCPKFQYESSIAILSYILEKNMNIYNDCQFRKHEWIDPAIDAAEVGFVKDKLCVNPADVRKCDEELGEFDPSKDVIDNENRCHFLRQYQRCIKDIVDKCSAKVRNVAFHFLNQRIKIAKNVCLDERFSDKEVVAEEEVGDKRILVESVMQSAIDIMLETHCSKKANPLMHVCTKQYQKRIDNMLMAVKNGTNEVLPHLCCAYAELTKCAFVITLLKCGQEDAFRVFQIAETLRQISSPAGCEFYQYNEPSCELVLVNRSHNLKTYISLTLIVIFVLKLLSN